MAEGPAVEAGCWWYLEALGSLLLVFSIEPLIDGPVVIVMVVGQELGGQLDPFYQKNVVYSFLEMGGGYFVGLFFLRFLFFKKLSKV
jgi:hypothetical protein